MQLLGRYLEFFGGSEISAAGDIPAGDEFPEEVRHPRRVMIAFARKFGEGSAEVELLGVLGLFDRPATKGAIDAVRAEPIPGLTERLAALNEGAWQDLLHRLRATGLVAPASTHDPDELDAHPLVREHFGEELREKHRDAWRAGHSRLYEHFKALPENEQPDTLGEMAPLFQAVFHGCQAGRHQEALDEVFYHRIDRGEAFVASKLGAHGAALAALASFFDPPWLRPVDSISEASRAYVLNVAGVCLSALGRLREALQPTMASLRMDVQLATWEKAAQDAGNLSERQLSLGEVVEAIASAEESVDYADRSGDAFQRMGMRTTLADARHQAGERARAEALFQEAERVQTDRQPSLPRLYSLWGYRYCDLLLDLGRHAEVRERATQTVEWARAVSGVSLLDIALGHLSLGRAELLAFEIDGGGELAKAEGHLIRAVDGLRKAGHIEFVGRGLLSRAAYFRAVEKFERARRDLDESLRIATRSGMRLFECDAHLEFARLELAQGNREAARTHLVRAEKLVAETGYHRHDRELEELKAALG